MVFWSDDEGGPMGYGNYGGGKRAEAVTKDRKIQSVSLIP